MPDIITLLDQLEQNLATIKSFIVQIDRSQAEAVAMLKELEAKLDKQ